MSTQDVKVPDVGVDDAVEIIEILVEKGEQVDAEAPIVVIETDKATVEVPCPDSGTIASIEVQVGDKVKEGDLLLKLDTDGEDAAQGDASEKQSPEKQDAGQESDENKGNGKSTEKQEKRDKTQPSSSAEHKETRDITVPDLGGSESVEVIEVLVAAGDEIDTEQALIVLESDKATMEIPSPAAGKLTSLSVSVGDRLSEGDVIGQLQSADSGSGDGGDGEAAPDGDGQDSASDNSSQKQASEPASEAPGKSVPKTKNIEKVHAQEGAKVHAGPAVRKLARELGADLAKVEGSGPKGRVLKDDLKAYVKSQVARAQDGGGAAGALPAYKLPDFEAFGEVEFESLDKIQRVTAANMSTSWLNVPHVTQFDEADITELEQFRKQQKAEAEKRGVKLTPLPFLLKSCAYVLQKLPQFNVSLDLEQQRMIRKKYVHIGMAVDTPAGLVVPVIRDVDRKSIWALAEECVDMAERAKQRKLSPQDMKGGCFTISSLGSLGGTAFTPIVNLPEVAILGVSKAEMKPKYDGEQFVPRLMLPLSLSYDHRAINGADAARFTTLLGAVLGDIRQLLL